MTYHLVGGGTGSPVDISMATFESHLDQLSAFAPVVSLDDAVAALQSGKPCDGPLVVLTFDDAYANFYHRAWPVLRRRMIPATLYVPLGFVSGTSPPPIRGTDGQKACTWDELREMVASGLLTIGSHTCTHPNLRGIPLREAEREIVDSRSELQERLNLQVDSFCYPQGKSSSSLETLVRANYSSAVVAGGIKSRPGRWSPYRLGRTPLRVDSPHNITSMLESAVWLEEWLSAALRPWLPSQRRVSVGEYPHVHAALDSTDSKEAEVSASVTGQ